VGKTRPGCPDATGQVVSTSSSSCALSLFHPSMFARA
jgi:hypothetical protein